MAGRKKPLLVAGLLLAGALAIAVPQFGGASPKGLDRKIDASSARSLNRSLAAITAEIREDEREQFTTALHSFLLRVGFEHATQGRPPAELERAMYDRLDGKTPRQIIELVRAASTGTAAPDAGDPVRPSIGIGGSVVIDGIRITIEGVRRGRLEGRRGDVLARAPEGEFLLVDVRLKNETGERIIHLMDVWSSTSLHDEFGNTHRSLPSLVVRRDDIEGAIASLRLRPGEQATDLMIFELPLDKARRFHVVSNPAFYRGDGDGLLHPLSDREFELRFEREAIR